MQNILSEYFDIKPYGADKVTAYPKVFACATDITELLIKPYRTFTFEKAHDTGNTILRRDTQTQMHMIWLSMTLDLSYSFLTTKLMDNLAKMFTQSTI